MSCPFFEPRDLLDPVPWNELWTHRPRVPLGEAYSGVCRARPGEPIAPSEEQQRELCNHGYARGRCERFPADCAADAVRFSVISEEPLRLVYILEKDHTPVEHGELDISAADGLLASQARAFAESYARLAAPARSTPYTCT